MSKRKSDCIQLSIPEGTRECVYPYAGRPGLDRCACPREEVSETRGSRDEGNVASTVQNVDERTESRSAE